MQKDQDKSWWVNETTAKIFNKRIERHILSLGIGYLLGDVPRACWISGFLIQVRGMLLWMTAGHIFKQLNLILERKDVGGIKARWIDNCPNKDAQCMPCDYASLHPISVDVEGYDFAIVLLRKLYVDQLLKVKENTPLTEAHWKLDDDFRAEGYYLVGLPREFSELEQIDSSSQAHGYRSTSVLVSVPLIGEDASAHQEEDEFWKHETNFYGKVFPIRNDDGELLTDISGMSGGPIFGVSKIDEGTFRYRVIAVQSSWLPQSMFTRGTRFDKVIALIDSGIELALSSNPPQVR